jgi:uridine kinase
MTIGDISNKIKKKHPKHKPIIIAVEGFVGSGKSTLAAKLKNELGDAYVVEIDDFFIKGKISDANKSNFDRKRLEEQVLLPIKNGRPAAYQKLEYSTNTLSKFIKVPDVKYLIIEGVSTFHPSIVGYMDYKIWVETPRDVADERGRKRDKELGDYDDELWEHWTKTDQDYIDLYHPEEAADFVFDNGRQL